MRIKKSQVTPEQWLEHRREIVRKSTSKHRLKPEVKEKERQYALDNREKLYEQHTERRRANRERAIELKGGKCNDCNGEFPHVVYDFHHPDPSQKEPKDFKPNLSWERYRKEVEKCILLCANCHRLRHNT